MIERPDLPRSPKTLAIVRTPSAFGRLAERLGGPGHLGVDTETTGLKWLVDRVGGISFAANDIAGYAYGDALGPAARYLSDQVHARRSLVFHNFKFDAHMLWGTFGLHIPYMCDDTQVMSFIVDNRGTLVNSQLSERKQKNDGGHRLKNLTAMLIDEGAWFEQEDLMASVKAAGGRDEGDILMGDPYLLGLYAGLDAWRTLQIRRHFAQRIASNSRAAGAIWTWRELYENEQWFTLAIIDMERRGIRVDPAFFDQWEKSLALEIASTEKRMRDLAGGNVGWGSGPELTKLLYGKLKLPILKRTEKKDVPSTDEATLLKLNHPFVTELLKWRELTKQHSTYAVGLQEAIIKGRIHCTIKQTGARTGRTSSSDPNLQQVPRESGARKGFIPDVGCWMDFADYSQIEMRFAAHETDEPTLVRGFCKDPHFDTHFATAQKMFGIREPNKRQRKFAKIANFLSIYGGGVDKLTEALLPMLTPDEAVHALIEMGVIQKEINRDEAHAQLAGKLLERYRRELPKVKKVGYRISDEVRELGYTTNVFGRRRYLPEEECYKGFNTKVQGAAGDQAKRGVVAIYRHLQLAEGAIALQMIIHDEAVMQSDGDPKTRKRVIELMQDLKTFRVPIHVEMEVTKTTWQDKAKWTATASHGSK